MDISEQVARKMISQYKDHLGFGLSIIDTRGIVLASTEQNRIGSFHEFAYSLVLAKKTKPIKIENDSDYLGGSAGVCMLLHDEDAICGAFAMLGEPKALLPLAAMTQLLLQNTIKYEQRDQSTNKLGFRQNFLNALVYHSDVPRGDLEMWAEHLHFNSGLTRFPLLIITSDIGVNTELMGFLKTTLSNQDILTTTRDEQIIIFKAYLEREENLFSSYRSVTEKQVAAIRNYLSGSDVAVTCYAGPFMNNLAAYNYGSQCVFWLRKNRATADIAYFYDHIQDYLYSRIAASDMHHLFSPVVRFFDQKSREDISRIVSTLDKHNYNLVKSSADLFMHRNTLSAILDRVKDRTGANPLLNASDRKLLWSIACYIENSGKGE